MIIQRVLESFDSKKCHFRGRNGTVARLFDIVLHFNNSSKPQVKVATSKLLKPQVGPETLLEPVTLIKITACSVTTESQHRSTPSNERKHTQAKLLKAPTTHSPPPPLFLVPRQLVSVKKSHFVEYRIHTLADVSIPGQLSTQSAP
ncbi:hypothetical protein BJX99DRAFT_218422, partial [Aspergillus californicus]